MPRPGDEPVPGYRIEAYLGRGQFGEVWRATAQGGFPAALKFIDLGGNLGFKEYRGVQRVKAIRHPHLMSMYASWLLDPSGSLVPDSALEAMQLDSSHRNLRETLKLEQAPPSTMVVAMELGEASLSDLLKDRKDAGHAGLPVDELLGYMEETAKGIDFLNTPQHDLGTHERKSIQHCDIKPDNIMLLGGAVKICDFGLARVLSSSGDVRATTTGITGSPPYMAPECIEAQEGEDHPKPSEATDQYALAIAYFELRTGDLPFSAKDKNSQIAILQAHREGRLEFDALPPAEGDVLRRATALKPRDRFASCAEMAQALRRAIGNQSADIRFPAPQALVDRRTTDTDRVPRSTIPDVPYTPKKRGPGRWTMAAVALTAACMIVGFVGPQKSWNWLQSLVSNQNGSVPPDPILDEELEYSWPALVAEVEEGLEVVVIENDDLRKLEGVLERVLSVSDRSTVTLELRRRALLARARVLARQRPANWSDGARDLKELNRVFDRLTLKHQAHYLALNALNPNRADLRSNIERLRSIFDSSALNRLDPWERQALDLRKGDLFRALEKDPLQLRDLGMAELAHKVWTKAELDTLTTQFESLRPGSSDGDIDGDSDDSTD